MHSTRGFTLELWMRKALVLPDLIGNHKLFCFTLRLPENPIIHIPHSPNAPSTEIQVHGWAIRSFTNVYCPVLMDQAWTQVLEIQVRLSKKRVCLF